MNILSSKSRPARVVPESCTSFSPSILLVNLVEGHHSEFLIRVLEPILKLSSRLKWLPPVHVNVHSDGSSPYFTNSTRLIHHGATVVWG